MACIISLHSMIMLGKENEHGCVAGLFSLLNPKWYFMSTYYYPTHELDGVPVFSLGCFWGGAFPCCANIPPYQCFTGCCTPHKTHGMQNLSVYNSYYQTVIHMQVHSNQWHNSDTCGGYGLDLRLVLWTPSSAPLISKFWREHCGVQITRASGHTNKVPVLMVYIIEVTIV